MEEKKYGKCIEEGHHNYELIGIGGWGTVLVFLCKNCEYEHHRRPNREESKAIKILKIDDQNNWYLKEKEEIK